MRLARYIQRNRVLGDAEIPVHELEAAEQAIEQGETLPNMVKQRAASFGSLTPRHILGIWRATRGLKAHQESLQKVAERRRAAGLPPIASALLSQTVAPHEVGVIERAEALAPPGAAAEHRRRDAIKEALLVWNACLAIGRREGKVKAALVTDDPALREEFGDLAGTSTIGEIAGHRWLALRRGEKARALALEPELPIEPMLAQIEAHGAGLSALSGGRDARQLFEALFLPDLATSLLTAKDEEATHQAIQSACDAWLGLLTAPRPKAELVAGIFPARQGELGVAVVQRDGRLVHHGVAEPGDDPLAAIEKVLGGQPVEGIVLPTTATDADLLNKLAQGFGPEMAVLRVKPTAMGEAVQQVEEEVPPPVASALVLARRAVRPIKYWGQVDPVSLGLAEYQQDLDAERLRASLQDMYQLAAAGLKLEDAGRPLGAPAAKAKGAAPRVPAPPLNPLVKTVDDLRPGMMVNGVITNVTQFGAFVNIGLSHEGLVHVSELADHFVKDPNEVVRVGQTVSVRVLGVDRARGRISLSMKPERAPAPRRDREEAPQRRTASGGVPLEPIGRGGNNRRDFDRPRAGAGGGGGGASRAQALAELEALFKKK